jgi:hypothetical protein
VLVIDQSEYIEDRPVPGPFPTSQARVFYFRTALQQRPWSQNKESNQKGHSFDVRRSRRHIPAYTRERAAAMFLGSIVREFYYKQYGENRTMIIKTAPFGI